MLFTGFEDRGLMFRGVLLDVSPPPLRGILRSGPSGTLQRRRRRRPSSSLSPLGYLSFCLLWQLLRCGMGRELDSKSADIVPEVRIFPPSRRATAVESPVYW